MNYDKKKITNPLDLYYEEEVCPEKDIFSNIDNCDSSYNDKKKVEEDLPKEKNIKDNQVEQLEKKIVEVDDKYKRLYADFENLKRRSAKDKLDLMLSANEKILKKILPILDDFDRAISSSSEEDRSSVFYTGIKLIHNKFTLLLEQSNVKMMNIKTAEAFDPNFHEAITSIPHEDINMKGKIIEVVEKGYYLNDTVLRFAKVIIAS